MIGKCNLNRIGWNVGIGFDRSLWYERGAIGWRRFNVAIFKLHTLPGDGEAVTRKHYRGFWFCARVWVPFELEQWR